MPKKTLENVRHGFIGYEDTLSKETDRTSSLAPYGSKYGGISAIFSQLCEEYKLDPYSQSIGLAYLDLLEDNESKFMKIQEGASPVFIGVSCLLHAIYVGFFTKSENERYMCIIDRTLKGVDEYRNVSFYKYDLSLLNVEVLNMLKNILQQHVPLFVQNEFTKLIGCTKDNFCKEVEGFIDTKGAFPNQKRGNCGVANAKPLYFFAKLFENPTLPQIEESFAAFKQFSKHCRQTIEKKTDLLPLHPQLESFISTSQLLIDQLFKLTTEKKE